MASKIKVDQIEGAAGTTVTLPSGQTLDLSSGTVTLPNNAVDLSSSKVTGTLGSGNLPTVPTSKGGTGLTSLGSAGQIIQVASGGSALEFANAAGGIVSSGGFSAGQNVFTYSFSDQTATSSNSFVDITGSEFNLGGGALTANKTCIFQYSVMRYEIDWNHTAIAFQYSTDDGSNWSYFESSENVHDEEHESASTAQLATRSGAFLLHNFTSGQTPRFRMKGLRYGNSNNLKINYDAGNNGTVNSHYVVWFI